MAITDRTLRTIKGLRIELDAALGYHETQLVTAWARAWSEVRDEWVDAIDDLVAMSKDGRWPTRTQIARARRAKSAFDTTTTMLDDLARDFQLRCIKDVPTFTRIGASWQAKLTASQLPDQRADLATLALDFDRISPAALDAIVERTTQQITALSRPLTAQATAAMRTTLVRGVALGENPRTSAAWILARLGGDFNGGLTRALVIARTELLDAHRAAAWGQDQANADTLNGWEWVAQLDRRTCPGCWSMHGSHHELIEPGPLDHQQGRCTRVPRLKTWAELGFDIDEPEDLLPNGLDTFDALPREDQLAIMGKHRLALLDSGQLDWNELAARRTADGWRDSYVPAPMHDLLRIVNRRGR